MGFSEELANEALTATGGNSTIEATEWIFSQQERPKNNNLVCRGSSSSPKSCNTNVQIQPKLDRFFQCIPIVQQQQEKPEPGSPLSITPSNNNNKRSKLSHSNNDADKQPLSERMRPRNIKEVLGQDHLLSFLGDCSDRRLPSIVFWGPPGTGKTSIARAISLSSSLYHFISLSAVTAGVKDVREAVEEARKMQKTKMKKTVLFVDEVHRFNKPQQDSLLHVIEDGSIVFMGATTENPSFHLTTPLLSRCRIFTLNPLQPHTILSLLRRAADDPDTGLYTSVPQGKSTRVEEEAFNFISLHCDGDARVALNALEMSAIIASIKATRENGSSCLVTLDDVKEALQCKHISYDRDGDEHYNLISALHKSMRGSDADASIYWLARMLQGGEEPLYIARRLVRFASEDVGMADPNAIFQAIACYQACHFLGIPECNVNLAQCVSYLALAPKSVAVYEALKAALNVVKESGGQNEGVPLHLRNAPTKLMKDIGYGKDYIYPPHNPDSSSSQTYLPPSLQGYTFLNWPPNTSNL
ncbi:hypothetical protein GIB67_014162 [Kingdonia uniflora]|uniref:UBA domain-containing protein n=1 Tax=Kingdonia uniflora TaxID=39325 RepID=A0A7J7NCF7_9MAGN|nr:hypothetical protein GIB67_014162 [Kingdonia uniflora]